MKIFANMPATEAISKQKDSFADDINGVVEEILKVSFESNFFHYIRELEPLTEKICRLTKSRTNLKIKLILDSEAAMAVVVYPNPYTALFSKTTLTTSDPKKLEEAFLHVLDKEIDSTKIKGGVDVDKCTVSGIYAEAPNNIYFRFDIFKKLKLTSKQVTAIFLHELGHIFTNYEFANNVNSTNQVLSESLREILTTKQLNKITLFKRLNNPSTNEIRAELEKILSGTDVVFDSNTSRRIYAAVRSQLGASKYDETSSEQVADQFVSRWNYGTYLVEGLNNLHGNELENYRFKHRYNAIMVGLALAAIAMLSIMFVAIFAVASLYLLLVKPLTGVFFIILTGARYYTAKEFIMSWSENGDHTGHMTYDDTQFRYKRLKEDMINCMKNDRTLTRAQITAVVEEIRAMDKLIEDFPKYKNFFSQLVDFIIPSARANTNTIETQRLLESLVANDLFVNSTSILNHSKLA